MSIKLSDSIRVGQQKPVEGKYFNELTPYTSIIQVNNLLEEKFRHIGLTVNINGEEYWYKDGIEDENLTFKSNQKTIEVNIWELQYDLIYQKKLEPGRLYKITLVEVWCFSGQLIKAIYLKAVTNNTLESEGVGEFYTPKYNELDDNLGIWKGELFANGMIDSLSYNIGDKVIWGNLFWENISGNVGTNEKEVEGLGGLKIDNYLSDVDWQLITPNDDESLYNIQFDTIKYDIENNYINYRADDLGNVYEITYNRLLTINHNYNLAIIKDPTFIYYLNSISLFRWGRDNVYNNIINESFVSNCNYNTTAFYDNTVDNSIMIKNNFLNVGVIGNDFKNASIVSNYLKTFGGIFNNELINSQILNNKYYFEISNNKLNNNSQINSNNDNNIIVNNKYTIIRDNILDNNCQISNNIFVEEGKEVDGTIKSIYGNELINNCSINNNTIKNGSRIMDHNLSYFSTINGNTLDTDSNIYNNQVIQGSKINNNILTGHGRIYGNQLDIRSEITNCKLRISPTSSYATTMKNNRLFAGKIQNIDFGDIVNPVGTNPNDPAFSGNALSECIIENNSIIKDLTFPNHGGVGIQFVKMNGFSEFKNITVNNSIRNVDFINTIFNETSDYSKLIEGNGYQTNGFTKTYIDGVLLQDRLDEKQDVLTEDNVGSFMDLELPTKLTPTSGDTVLARDVLTNKAVEIPITSLGGGGNIDTSNLVPYTGANKDVNIASNYFKTSKGFDFTKDADNYFTSYYGGGSCFLDFSSKDDGTFGSINVIVNPENFNIIKTNNVDLTSNYFTVTNEETLSLKPFVSESGFKTPTGTATQALTADGGVFDLNTKADLEGGKVPATQSRPSTIVMDNSTYVITFTDATGTVHTIDLPLESLFKDANYDETTKSLIVTLDNGTTKSIPLSDLVDLPEIVLSTSNPAVTPTTGQKVYFNTDLGKVWFNVSGVWVFGGNLISDSEKTNLTTAYDHSQTTGNPHNTKVEELTDVSGDDTTIVDTDVILKKETGGLWKKLSWSNIKATLKAYFDSIYAPKAFNVKVTTPSSWVTGTLSETEVYRFSIPANTISSQSILSIESMLFRKIGVNGGFHVRVKLTTSATMPTGYTEQIARTPNVAPNVRATAIRRKFYVNGDVMTSQNFDSGLYFDEYSNSDAISSMTLNRTQTYNVIISVTLSNVSDQVRLEGLDFNIK